MLIASTSLEKSNWSDNRTSALQVQRSLDLVSTDSAEPPILLLFGGRRFERARCPSSTTARAAVLPRRRFAFPIRVRSITSDSRPEGSNHQGLDYCQIGRKGSRWSQPSLRDRTVFDKSARRRAEKGVLMAELDPAQRVRFVEDLDLPEPRPTIAPEEEAAARGGGER